MINEYEDIKNKFASAKNNLKDAFDTNRISEQNYNIELENIKNNQTNVSKAYRERIFSKLDEHSLLGDFSRAAAAIVQDYENGNISYESKLSLANDLFSTHSSLSEFNSDPHFTWWIREHCCFVKFYEDII